MSSTNLGSILIFASCVVVGTLAIYYVGMWVSFFHLMGGVLAVFCSLIFFYMQYLILRVFYKKCFKDVSGYPYVHQSTHPHPGICLPSTTGADPCGGRKL